MKVWILLSRLMCNMYIPFGELAGNWIGIFAVDMIGMFLISLSKIFLPKISVIEYFNCELVLFFISVFLITV